MSLRQLRARLDRLDARFPEGDEESIARARYDHLRLRIGRGEMELLTDAEKSEYNELFMSLCVHLPPATTDEDRAARARWNDLRRRATNGLRKVPSEGLEALTEAERIEFDELTIRYHFLGDSIKAWRDVAKKQRAEGEERSRLQQLERQKKAAAATRIRSEADSSHCPDGTGGKETSRFRQVERKREAAAAVRIDYEDNSDCWPIDDDDDL
jgi:hypothetical protein